MLKCLFLVIISLFYTSIVFADFYLGGIQVNEPDHEIWSNSLKKEGYNTASITVYAHQGDWDSDNLWWNDKEDAVVKELKTAKKNGLKTVLILRTALDHSFKRNTFLWHGMIMPKEDSQLKSWFVRYSEFAKKWAKIAQEENVDVFGIGSELNSLTSTLPATKTPSLIDYYLDQTKQSKRNNSITSSNNPELNKEALLARGKGEHRLLEQFLNEEAKVQTAWALQVTNSNPQDLSFINKRRALLNESWKEIIRQVRAEFSGKLTYAANFDQYFEVGFWSDLDFMGINAYFPLRNTRAENIYTALEQGWETVFKEIKNFSAIHNLNEKQIIFTELGYTFRKNSTVAPWASDGFSFVEEFDPPQLFVWKNQKIDFSERALALLALKNISDKNPNLLKGLLYWKLSTQKSHLEIEPFVHILGDPQDLDFAKTIRSFATK
jgi:hypothetical protein